MQQARVRAAEAQSRKAKLTNSYQALLDEFSSKDLSSVGNYTLGRLIGKGSFGKVYLASHKLTNGSKVVLKSAKKDDSNLAREIHHHRQFVHPHIARLYEVIVTETMVWLVLEYCQGDELYNHLLKHGRLAVDKVQRTFAQLVGAVSYVHQESCVHRDLKLENILLDKHENVKLVDFGFTREYEGKANYLQTFCGTICYSAPEMLKGEKYAGEKVDVWSLGIILYALLCGELPFDDDDDDVTRRRILTEEPAYPDHLPADALALLRQLLSKRPLLRPSLPDILSHAFLAEHAPQQQTILQQPRHSPFTTPLEKETLHRMRSAGVDIDAVIESVLAQRCDALAGWWTLLIEKEQRKHARRERKRREKEKEQRDLLDRRSSRRLSATSSRLERLATVGEEGDRAGDGQPPLSPRTDRTDKTDRTEKTDNDLLPPTPRSTSIRGRSQHRRRSGNFDQLRIEDFPGLSELGKLNEEAAAAQWPGSDHATAAASYHQKPPPIDKDSVRSVRSASSSRHRRPIPPPKEGVLRSARSRGSTLHLVTASDALAAVQMARGISAGGTAGANGTKRRVSGAGAGGAEAAGVGGAGTGSGSGRFLDQQKVRRKTSQAIMTHWKNMTHWIVETARPSKKSTGGRRGGSNRNSHSMPSLLGKGGHGRGNGNANGNANGSSPRPQTTGAVGGGLVSDSTMLSPPTGGGGSGGPGSGGPGGPGGLGGAGSGGGGGSGRAVSPNTSSLPRGVVVNGYRGVLRPGGGGSAETERGGTAGGGGTESGQLANAANLAVGGSARGQERERDSTKRYSNASLQSQKYTFGGSGGNGANSGNTGNSGSARLQTNYKRQSLSPSPLTPRSTVRRSSGGGPGSSGGGLRGRKSTSSSISSIRSMHHGHHGSSSSSAAAQTPYHHHQHSHSKASSTSSNGSVATSTLTLSKSTGRSPHHSTVKVLPATPTLGSFPSNLRLVRGSGGGGGSDGGSGSRTPRPMSVFNEGMPLGRPVPGSPNPFGISGGGLGTPTVMFAKRKRSLFKGPFGSINMGGLGGSMGSISGGGAGGGGGGGRARSGSHSRNASASGLGRRSGEITIAEEDEEEEEDVEEMDGDEDVDDLFLGVGIDEVEEVDSFSPVIQRPGERVEEKIYEEGEEEEAEAEAETAAAAAAARDGRGPQRNVAA